MISSVQLPELPLMLAGLSRPVAALLREAGIPAEPLPAVPLLAAGTGRFVLFDSRSSRSAARARRAVAQGLKAIDVAEFLPESKHLAPNAIEIDGCQRLASESTRAQSFLEQLKAAVEARGGVWVRLADYPFPYQSAIAMGIEHVSEDLAEFAAVAAALPGKATHFVSSRLRSDRLAFLSQSLAIDLGWQIRSCDYESSSRKTLSHWTTRMERFAAANLQPAGLAMSGEQGPIVRTSRLMQLGLCYSCHESTEFACRAEVRSHRASAAGPWICFNTLALPPRERFLEWVGEHYQSGCPLFLTATTERLDLVQELLEVGGDARRCSLMWQTSFGEFARWWALRSQLRLNVWRNETGYEVHATGEFGRFPWAIEMWRGKHLATLPLRNRELTVPYEGLVYLQSAKRNPAGCTAPGEGVRNLVMSREGAARGKNRS